MSMADFIARELAAKERAYKDGNLGALRDAVAICHEYTQALPGWAVKALLEDNADMLLGKKKTGEGRHSKWLEQYKADIKALERYETVLLCREHNIPWKNVYNATALILEGSHAAGSEHTMKKAYQRVDRRQRDNPGRYHILSHRSGINTDLNTARPLTPERAEMWAKVRRMSKTPDKMG